MDDLVLKKHYNQFWEARFFFFFSFRVGLGEVSVSISSLGKWYQMFQSKGWYRDIGKHYLLTIVHITKKKEFSY
jgi:hypothetical protein